MISVHVCAITHTVDARHPRVGGKHAFLEWKRCSRDPERGMLEKISETNKFMKHEILAIKTSSLVFDNSKQFSSFSDNGAYSITPINITVHFLQWLAFGAKVWEGYHKHIFSLLSLKLPIPLSVHPVPQPARKMSDRNPDMEFQICEKWIGALLDTMCVLTHLTNGKY